MKRRIGKRAFLGIFEYGNVAEEERLEIDFIFF